MYLVKKLILPVGLFLAFIFAVWKPEYGVFCKNHFGVELTVIIIFMIGGYVHKFSEVSFNRKFYLLIITSVFSNLLFLPFLGFVIADNILPSAFAAGVIVIVSMPPTLSSGIVITEVAEGNTVLAMILTISLNIIGLITVPIVIKLVFSGISNVNVNSEKLFINLLFIVLIPFIAGRLFKFIIPKIRGIEYIKLLSPVCIVAAVWICLSTSADLIFQVRYVQIAALIMTAVIIHTVFLTVNYLLIKIVRISVDDAEAFLFVVSQKTMPLAMLILVSIASDISRAVIACVIYHFMQIMFDSILATLISKIKNKKVLITL